MTQVAKYAEQTRNVSLVLLPNSLTNLAAACEVEVSSVSAIVAGINKSLRRSDRVEVLASLTADIEFVTRIYCGVDLSTDDELQLTCVEFILKNFAHLGIGELKEAFSLAAAGKLGKIDLSAYYGKFTIRSLGEVLKLYGIFREKAVRELRKAEAEAVEIAAAAEKLARKSEMLMEHAEWCADKIEYYIRNDAPRYDLIPVVLYEYLEGLELIILNRAAKLELMERAKPIVRASFGGDLQTEPNEFKKRSIREIITQLDNGILADRFVARQKVVARQLAVLDYINFYKTECHATPIGTS